MHEADCDCSGCLYGEPEVSWFCDHDVPEGCSDCQRGRAWEALWDAVERGEADSPFGPVEEDLAPFGPAWQDERRERGW